MKNMKFLLLVICIVFNNFCLAQEVETIVFLRHAEKPDNGLGQLNCQGLHRALSLPKVLVDKYGKPDLIFAPNASVQKEDKGVRYDYVRPLATIEPTAITLGLPVSNQWGFEDITSLKSELLQEKNKGKIIYVAWEHRLAEKLIKEIMKNFDNPTTIPVWGGYDFDSLYVLKITTENNKKLIIFSHEQQNLNNESEDCNFK